MEFGHSNFLPTNKFFKAPKVFKSTNEILKKGANVISLKSINIVIKTYITVPLKSISKIMTVVKKMSRKCKLYCDTRFLNHFRKHRM